ncbi:GNAT family N-acetyltransferase [Micromonospora sp. B11E3]|uniref:GNAT family N-acetyltransferase n=1 Tax=Micromonospora sp. B11E3 TaxID=3153562 RepID=UPI00325DAE68
MTAAPSPQATGRTAPTATAVTATVRRVTPQDTARMRALRLEMLADAPLAFLETVADAAARPHAEIAARVASVAAGPRTAQFVAEPHDAPAGRPTGDANRPIGEANRLGRAGRPVGEPGRLTGRAGRLVGHAGGTVAPHDPGLTVIYAVYVTPAWRGTGLLADLIEAVAAWSRECGRPELMLEVVVGNDRACRAYRRLGFVDTGVRVPHPKFPTLRELQMRRPA